MMCPYNLSFCALELNWSYDCDFIACDSAVFHIKKTYREFDVTFENQCTERTIW